MQNVVEHCLRHSQVVGKDGSVAVSQLV